jgi:CRISPR-associated protein Cas6
MFWQEDEQSTQAQVPDDVIDLVFDIECRELPVDHQCGLADALCQHLPELREDNPLAVHSIHIAGSQNGWERPDPKLGQKLIPSRRTKLTLRVPAHARDKIENALNGVELDISGCALRIGKAKTKKLSNQGTIFARYIVLESGEDQDENAFMQRVAGELTQRGIRVRKALSGKTTELEGPDGPILTRSLMIADLTTNESVQLQQEGLGPLNHMGCGIFIPHKGIEAVKKAEDDS